MRLINKTQITPTMVIRFYYVSDGEVDGKNRTVIVEQLHSGGYIDTFDLEKGEPRRFRLDKIDRIYDVSDEIFPATKESLGQLLVERMSEEDLLMLIDNECGDITITRVNDRLICKTNKVHPVVFTEQVGDVRKTTYRNSRGSFLVYVEQGETSIVCYYDRDYKPINHQVRNPDLIELGRLISSHLKDLQ